MTKHLPYISIEGVGETPEEKIASLEAIRPKLIEAGYENQEAEWNSAFVKDRDYWASVSGDMHYGPFLSCDDNVMYINFKSGEMSFRADQIHEILTYIENYKG